MTTIQQLRDALEILEQMNEAPCQPEIRGQIAMARTRLSDALSQPEQQAPQQGDTHHWPQQGDPTWPQQAPRGWKLVPLEPTDAMVVHGLNAPGRDVMEHDVEGIYRAMLAVAPAAPGDVKLSLKDELQVITAERDFWKHVAEMKGKTSHRAGEKVWAIDTSAGRPILVLNGCSVIEAEDAAYVIGLIKAAQPTPQAEPSGERAIAVMEGHQVAATDAYFSARQKIDTIDRRRVYEAAYQQAWRDRAALLSAEPKAGAEPVAWRADLDPEQVPQQLQPGLPVVLFRKLRDAESWVASKLEFEGWRYQIEPLCAHPPAAQKPLLEEMLSKTVKALGDLSFECFDVFATARPSVKTYNETFAVLEEARKFLKERGITGKEQQS